MKGVVLSGDRQVHVREFPTPEPGPGEVRVKMQAAGLCGSDLHIIYERPPSPYWGDTIAGHEPCGVVDEVGPGVTNYQAGDRVIVMWVTGCGRCPSCFAGDLDRCENSPGAYGWGLNGAFADYILAREISLVPMPDELSFEAGAFLSCAATTSYQAIKRLAPDGLDTVACIGLGPVGLSGVIWAKAFGARVVGVEMIPERLELARRLGADEVINGRETNAVQAIKDLTNGRGADVALDFSGSQGGRNDALDCARVNGRAGFVGEGGETTINVSRLMIHKNLTVIGSRIFDKPTLAEAARLVVERQLNIDGITTGRYALAQAEEAFRTFETGHTGKLYFTWN